AQKLEGVVDAFEQERAVDLPLRYVSKIGTRAQGQLARSLRQTIVGKAERIIETLIQKTHLQKFDIGKFEDRQHVFGIFLNNDRCVPIHDGDIIFAERNSMRESIDDFVLRQFASFRSKDLRDVLGMGRGQFVNG